MGVFYKFFNPNDPSDVGLDPDRDGLTNFQEYQAGTLFQITDTDGDGFKDSVEISQNTNPPNSDHRWR